MIATLYMLSLISLAAYTFFKYPYELHMMQLNSYMNDRYFKWLKKDILSSNRRVEYSALAAIALLLFFRFDMIAFVICTLVFAFLSFQIFKNKPKKPLVFTKRATRLLITMISLLIILLLTIKLGGLGSSFLIISWVALLTGSFIWISIANILVAPIENYIKNWYYRDAQRILREMPNLIIIGITGSYGKTSTKHFLHRVLSEQYNVLMTPGSYNTTMGVVLTIRKKLQPTHQVFIVEMGAKKRGDIKEICDLVHPSIGILTAVGEAHLETFKSVENIKKTKFELIDALPSDGLAVLNSDYDPIRNNKSPFQAAAEFYASSNNGVANYMNNIQYAASGSTFTAVLNQDHSIELETKLLGVHNLSNMLASVIVARHLGMKDDSIRYAVSKIRPVEHRLEVKHNRSGVTVIDDAFNSNPIGAKMALDVLKAIEGKRKIIITPGMIELGAKQYDNNKIFGTQIANTCDYVILVGKTITQPIFEGLKEAKYNEKNIFVAHNLNDATRHLNGMIRQGDVLLYENDLPDTYEQTN